MKITPTLLIGTFAVLEAAAIVALIVTLKSPEPVDKPEEKPLSWDDQETMKWLYGSPFKANMRSFWVSCARIVSAGRGDGTLEPSHVEITQDAADVAQRAARQAIHWEHIRDHAQELVTLCADPEWSKTEVVAETDAIWTACLDCHFQESWSFAYRHITKVTIGEWLANKPASPQNETDEAPPPKIPHRDMMKTLETAYKFILDACDKAKGEEIVGAAQDLVKIGGEQATYWRNIHAKATELVELSKKKVTSAEYGKVYNEMTANCVGCHSRYVLGTPAGPRPMLMPMPWEGPLPGTAQAHPKK